ncbi:MAG: succinylglutamate desuccinylase/aspartoacylase family protein, partial [Natronomonas sp.]|nr:succinylglutamate desuccinylase/aspartoacylase family protein [Natronomonas sp.]
MTTLGTASAAPGEIDIGRLPVGEARDGSEIGLPVAVINGRHEGKTLYIQAVSDGDELNGLGVIRRFVPQLEPEELAGAILIVGIANYYGFLVAEHRNPIDDTKLNRTFPGNPSGTASERISAAIFDAVKRADLALDLHQGSTSCMINETRVRCGSRHRLHHDCLELAKVFGCGHILDLKGPDGQLARAAPDKGIPTVDPELGGAVGWDETSIQKGVKGVFNVLYHYGFLDGEITTTTQTRASSFEQYGSPSGGLVSFEVGLGDEVERGDTLFEVTDPFG